MVIRRFLVFITFSPVSSLSLSPFMSSLSWIQYRQSYFDPTITTFLSLSLCLLRLRLCVCLSLYASVCVYLSISVCVYLSISVCVYLSISVCVYLSISVCVYLSISVCVCLSTPLCLSLSASVSFTSSTHHSVSTPWITRDSPRKIGKRLSSKRIYPCITPLARPPERPNDGPR